MAGGGGFCGEKRGSDGLLRETRETHELRMGGKYQNQKSRKFVRTVVVIVLCWETRRTIYKKRTWKSTDREQDRSVD